MIVRRKIVGGVLAAVAASGLMFAGSSLAAADHYSPHKHCLWTPEGWVPLAEGVSLEADRRALDEFHDEVHRRLGAGADGVLNTADDTIRRIGINDDCSVLEGQSPV